MGIRRLIVKKIKLLLEFYHALFALLLTLPLAILITLFWILYVIGQIVIYAIDWIVVRALMKEYIEKLKIKKWTTFRDELW